MSFKNRPPRQPTDTEPLSEPQGDLRTLIRPHGMSHSIYDGREPGEKTPIVPDVFGLDIATLFIFVSS